MGIDRRLLVCLFVGTLCLGLRAAEEPVPIKVRRSVRGGESFNVHLIFEQTRRETALPPAAAASAPTVNPASAPAPLERVLKADLTCRVDVLDVDRRGHTSAWVTVSKFMSLADNKEIVPPGKVIGILDDDVDMYVALRGGGELTADARTVIPHLYPLGYQLDETSFGSKSPRRPGESWGVDAVSVAQIDSNPLFEIDPQTVQGKVTLVGLEKTGDTAAMRLNIAVKHCGKDRVPKIVGETINHQDLAMQINVLYPQDPTLPPVESQIVTDATATVTRRTDGDNPAKQSAFEVRTRTITRQTITPIAK
jgi:hypothetical protein